MTCRVAFAEHLGKRVQIAGYYENSDTWHDHSAYRQWPRCCIVDVDLGGSIVSQHIWVHHARPLKSLDPQKGERVQLTGVVCSYKKQLRLVNGDGVSRVTDYLLDYPEQIILPDREVRSKPPVLIPNPIIPTLAEVKALADRLGGEQAVATVLTQYADVQAVADRVGGIEPLMSILKMLR
jgi:hypothetical protein